ncbi:MAG: hypothetical protein JWO56_1930 [Acidobacteria bacterium]|nr:hypothetical protein [Acidobacteriota bacterium]
MRTIMRTTMRSALAVVVLAAALGGMTTSATAQETQTPQPPQTLAQDAQRTVRKGMTWTKAQVDPVTGTIGVTCNNCNAYTGDTPCTTPLPFICIRKSGPGFPLPLPVGLVNSNRYYLWSGGVIATTAATVPPATLAAANTVCSTQFGTDWRVAEFHDGWGWGFQAYGGTSSLAKRYWLHINDQPNATCWR